MDRKDITVDGQKFTLTELGHDGFNVGVRKWNEKYDEDHFIVKTVGSTFNNELYSFPHTPILISQIAHEKKFSTARDLRVLDMPIKFPHSNEYRIPRELNQFDEVISKIVSFEHTINPYAIDFFAYITIDQSNVSVDTYPRRSGCHADGLQGAGTKFSKRIIGRSYLAYDGIPTVFYPQSFDTSYLDENTDNFFMAFDDQADIKTELTFDPYTILAINPYTVHRSDLAKVATYRTFLRISYDTFHYRRFGNTHNNMFDYKWGMISSKLQSGLRHKVKQVSPNAY